MDRQMIEIYSYIHVGQIDSYAYMCVCMYPHAQIELQIQR